ncbi:Peptidase C78 [Gracilaria domingensis]|nr:Peptidase C78 [Gracilaria domingensis]
MSTQSNLCPICDRSFPGNLPELERHVNQHLDVDEQNASAAAAQHLALAENAAASQSSPNGVLYDDDEIQKGVDPARAISRHVHPTDIDRVLQHHHDEIYKGEDPARAILQQVEQSDAELARAIAAGDQPQTSSSQLPEDSRFADCVEHCYVNIIRKIMPNIDLFDQSRKTIHLASRLDFYSSNLAGFGWDCGFRNIQMLFSSLLYEPASAAILAEADIKEVPSIPEIAAGIENAWSKGFDPEGAANFDGSLTDKEVWIGATEAFVLFRSLNLNAFVTDFETPTDSERKLMFQWIFKHFEKCCGARNCSLHLPRKARVAPKAVVCPIFCQWQGHSLTIVGAEKTRNGDIFLVVLDPSRAFIGA